MILTSPTKNLRKRSNTNTAETYGVTFKTKTRNSESKKAGNLANQETQKPRDPETKKPGEQKVGTMARCKMKAVAATWNVDTK